ncbi:isochorismatase family protein [Ochrobactrum soli]|uniref:Isochorismatase family protein n=1 Tax=Ochrobactrum soli TaxID=2448455 RepID=A0A849KSE6_9HYPH|nr:isochorismatase family protein [[Ochrobactrum] soli]NNU63233.1 isochorismatase family protein [[Ochrobactrum] soli]
MADQENLDANYKRAFGKRLGYGRKPALILIDFVEAYFDPNCALYAGVEDALASAVRLVDMARANGIPVLYTNVVYADGGINGGRFYQKSMTLHNFIEGSPMGAWANGVAPQPGEIVISKQYPSAFFGTSLASTLASLGIDTLIHTGLSTSGCVRATCVDCSSHGFIPIIVRDAVGDRHSAPHEANLFDMDAKYGDVVNETDVITYMKSWNN